MEATVVGCQGDELEEDHVLLASMGILHSHAEALVIVDLVGNELKDGLILWVYYPYAGEREGNVMAKAATVPQQ